jgi:hypothetical protein
MNSYWSRVWDAVPKAFPAQPSIQPQNNTYFQLFYVVIGVEMKKRLDTASTFWSTSNRQFGNKPKADSVSAKAP